MTSDQFEYTCILDATEEIDGVSGTGTVTINLTSASGAGRVNRGNIVSELYIQLDNVQCILNYDGPPVPEAYEIYGEMLKEWSVKRGSGMTITPGFWEDVGWGAIVYRQSQWNIPNNYYDPSTWNLPGFDDEDIAAELNNIGYFVDYAGVNWKYYNWGNTPPGYTPILVG